jgi:hypothetical protein
MQNTTDKAKWIGYSNGVAYPVYKVKDDVIGLCQIEGHLFMQWCTFEKIIPCSGS